MLTQEIIKYANIVRNKYRFEIDGCINPSCVFKVKFKIDQQKWKDICNNLYKKLK